MGGRRENDGAICHKGHPDHWKIKGVCLCIHCIGDRKTHASTGIAWFMIGGLYASLRVTDAYAELDGIKNDGDMEVVPWCPMTLTFFMENLLETKPSTFSLTNAASKSSASKGFLRKSTPLSFET